jgi:hypothetical protein
MPPASALSRLETFDPYELLPAFVRRCLYIGPHPAILRQRCKKGIDEFWCAGDPAQASAKFSTGYFDAVLMTEVPGSTSVLRKWLAMLAMLLDRNGLVSMVLPDVADPDTAVRIHAALDGPIRLMVYYHNPAAGILWMVNSGYNPVLHARQMADQGRPGISIQILGDIPMDLVVNEEMLADIAAEKQRYYLDWQKQCVGDPPHSWFSKSQREFAQATAINPGLAKAYQTQAEYWQFLGDRETGHAVWRSFLQSIATDDETVDCPPNGFGKHPAFTRDATEIQRKLPNPRILVLGHSSSDYGMDTLYDGLCRLIGRQNVVEYPAKPTLHGENFEAAQSYPCTFTYARGPSSAKELIALLEAGRFDVILYADVVEMNRSEEVRLFLKAAPDLPLVVYDSWDDCYTPMKAILEYIDRTRVDLVFKREMLSQVDYGENTFPLPFGYPASKIEKMPASPERRYDFFWAGKREFGLRPLMLPRAEKVMGRRFERVFDQTAYKERLRHSRIGLSLWGYGFDTVRFWEIPANGGMLLAQRPPIRIPHNFADGHSAVFFDDLNELEAKLTYYRDHPETAAEIAAAGHRQWQTYHTTEARAAQMLNRIEQRCGW